MPGGAFVFLPAVTHYAWSFTSNNALLKNKKKRFRQRIFCSLDGSAVTDVAQDMTPSLLAQDISLLQVGDLVAKEDWNQLDKIMTK